MWILSLYNVPVKINSITAFDAQPCNLVSVYVHVCVYHYLQVAYHKIQYALTFAGFNYRGSQVFVNFALLLSQLWSLRQDS